MKAKKKSTDGKKNVELLVSQMNYVLTHYDITKEELTSAISLLENWKKQSNKSDSALGKPMPIEIPSDSLLNAQIDENQYILPSYMLDKMWVLKDSLIKQDQIVVYDSKKVNVSSIVLFDFIGRERIKECPFSISLFCYRGYEKPVMIMTKDNRKAIACISGKTHKLCNFREIVWDSHFEGKEVSIGLDREGNFFVMLKKEDEINGK